MHLLAEILADGFVMGAIFALGAAGLTIIFGVSGVLNLCHGSIMVVGAMVAWYCAVTLNLPVYLSALVGVAASVTATYALYYAVVVPLQRSRRVAADEREVFIFVATLMVAVILHGVLNWAFGSTPITTPPLVHGTLGLGSLRVPFNQVLIAAVAWFVLLMLWAFITGTRLGKAMLAASMSPTGLAIVGYDIDRVYFLVWGLYGILSGIGGVLLASFIGANSSIALELTASAFTIVVLGGLGNVLGSLAAAYILAYIGSLTAYLVAPSIRELPGLFLLIIILYVRPRGLFGRR